MPTITDFTKSRLTQAFESKGNLGSSLSEQLQPVVVAHDLERGPFTPYVRFSLAAQCTAVAAVLPHVCLIPTPANVEQTIIIDSVFADAPFRVGVNDVVSLVSQGTPFVWSHDLRTPVVLGGGGTSIATVLKGDFTSNVGTSATDFTDFSVLGARLHWGAAGRAELGVIFPRVTNIAGTFPQLVVNGVTVNTALTVTINGRLVNVQS